MTYQSKKHKEVFDKAMVKKNENNYKLMYHMSRIFQDKLAKGEPLERGVDRKLRRQIEKKKKSQGLRQ